MQETMHDCYLSQFTCMKNILINKDVLIKEFAEFYLTYKPDRVYLLGSGTSYNACAVAASFMVKVLHIEVTPIVPSTLDVLYGKKPLVIAVSQSGRSTNTIAAIEKYRADGITVVTLTDPQHTPVSKAGCLAVHLSAELETIGPRTRGYSATILTLQLMALECGVLLNTISQTLYHQSIACYNEIIKRGEDYYAACQDFYDANFENLKKAKKYIFAGKGSSAKLAAESALKVLETLCYPALGYEYEEFLHGPACCADEELALFLYLSDDDDWARMLKTADIMSTITPNCYMITGNPDIKKDHVLTLPSNNSDDFTVFSYMLIGQLISAKLTEDLGRLRHPGVKDIFSDMGTKCPFT